MQQKKPSLLDRLTRKFPPFPIYLSDLEQIILCAASRGLKIEISDEQNLYDDLNDLQEHRAPKAKTLRLNFREESEALRDCTVEISSEGLRVSANKTDVMVPVWHEIVNYVDGQIPWYAKATDPFGWFFATFVAEFAVPKQWLQSIDFPVQAVVLSVMILISLWSLYYRHSSRGVHLRRKHEVLGLWDRYGEKLTFLILGAAVGIGAKWVGDHFLGKRSLTGRSSRRPSASLRPRLSFNVRPQSHFFDKNGFYIRKLDYCIYRRSDSWLVL